MDTVTRCVALGVLGALLALVVRRQNGALGVLVSLAVVLSLGYGALTLMQPIVTFGQQLAERAELDQTVVSPVLKTLAIGFLTETGKNICQDAGEGTIAGALSLAGGLEAFYVLLPLLESVLELLEGIL
jgi:stage III sporulation protein AD